uniref:Tetraspanin n=1 Tax=Branchiostoma belcheri tsingtauense TaxID=155462 RepID=Q2TCR8_BRABE|nr:tetraspanin family protein [Branchiostoma belcheri tsingtauense]
MEAKGGMQCIKYLLFAFNLIFWITGLAMIGVGATVKIAFGDYFDFTGNAFASAPVFLIILGVFVSIIGFLGCCGAIKENYCMVTTFAGRLSLIFILEIAAGITGYVLRNDIENVIDTAMTDFMMKWTNKTEGRLAFDGVHKKFECCGVTNYTDWFDKSPNFNPNNQPNVPGSCCLNAKTEFDVKNPDDTCGEGADTTKINTEGCLLKLEGWLAQNILIIGGVGIGIAFIQVVGIIFACCLMRSIKQEYEVV